MTSSRAEHRIRQLLLFLSILSFGATFIELILQEHTGEPLQLLPFALCALGVVAAVIALVRPGQISLRLLRGAMVIIGLGGVFGMVIHLWRNFEFEQEIRPNAAMIDLIGETLKGASPLLAPGALVFAALIALIATYYHPSLGKQDGG